MELRVINLPNYSRIMYETMSLHLLGELLARLSSDKKKIQLKFFYTLMLILSKKRHDEWFEEEFWHKEK